MTQKALRKKHDVTSVVNAWPGPSLSLASFMMSWYKRSHCSTAHVSNTFASSSCFFSFSSVLCKGGENRLEGEGGGGGKSINLLWCGVYCTSREGDVNSKMRHQFFTCDSKFWNILWHNNQALAIELKNIWGLEICKCGFGRGSFRSVWLLTLSLLQH